MRKRPRGKQKANKDKPDDQGYDYDRAWLAGKMDLFLDNGKKVASYTRAAAGPDLYRVEFTLEGGAKKAYHVKLVSGGGPGLWLVDEFTLLP